MKKKKKKISKQSTESIVHSQPELPENLQRCQSVLWNDEILICGGFLKRACYSYHIPSKKYQKICDYPSTVTPQGHAVVIINQSKSNSQVKLLSLGGKDNHMAMMTYQSVWKTKPKEKEGPEEQEEGEKEETTHKNEWKWIRLLDRSNGEYEGCRVVIGGKRNDKLFVTHLPNRIDMIDLNDNDDLEWVSNIENGLLPVENSLSYHCFVPLTQNNVVKKNHFICITKDKNLQIRYHAEKNMFSWEELPLPNKEKTDNTLLIHTTMFSYVNWNDCIFFFGGIDDVNGVTNTITAFSMTQHWWVRLEQARLPLNMCHSFATLYPGLEQIHLMGGLNPDHQTLPYHFLIHCQDLIAVQSKSMKDVSNEINEKDEEEGEVESPKEKLKSKNEKKDDVKRNLNRREKEEKEEKEKVKSMKKEVHLLEWLTEISLESRQQLAELVHDENELKLQIQKKMKSQNLTFDSKQIPMARVILESIPNKKTLMETIEIKNPLVIMLAISEYEEQNTVVNVWEKDLVNYQELFEGQLKYEFVCNESNKLTRNEAMDFIDNVILSKKLRDNENGYDAIVMIICGHGDNNDVLLTSDNDEISVPKLRSKFNCDELRKFTNYPKIFIMDICRGRNLPNSHEQIQKVVHSTNNKHIVEYRGTKTKLYGHTDDGYVMIWSTTEGFQVPDSSYLSEYIKQVMTDNYQHLTLHQIILKVRQLIRQKKKGDLYCIQTVETVCYDIMFNQKLL